MGSRQGKRGKAQGTGDKREGTSQRRKGRSVRWLMLIAVLVAMWLPAGGFAHQQPPPSKPAAQDGFVPVDQLDPKEELPAAPLVMAAYAVAWLVVFGYVWSLWRRLQAVEAEIADVSRRVAAGARR
jgi:CcmD family protein